MTQPEFVAPLVPSVVPADTLNKSDLYAHLQEFHGSHVGWGHNLTSKSTKAKMEEAHDRLHERIDYTQAQQALVEGSDGYTRYVENPALKDVPYEERNKFANGHSDKVHEHIVVPTGPASEDEREVLNKVQNGELGRVLSVTERKALERLIDNDFASLRNEMTAYAADVLTERLKGVDSDFADKRKEAERLRKEACKAITEANAKVQKVLTKAKEAGVKITGSPAETAAAFTDAHLDNIIKAVVEGQAEATKKVQQENRSDLQQALHTLERQRLASQRLVLLAGISPEGQKLLDTVPDARALMIEAAQERAAKAITA